MEQYIVSARKYRPSTFKTVVGQGALTSTLKNAIRSGRLAHSYLFCGSRGVGKTSCARIFAKTINCEHLTADGEACNECASCVAFNRGASLNIVELDAASNNGVDDIRSLVEQVQSPPATGRYRVFIVDEVHMLSSQAFNAFLKTLEEPPEYVVFILATTEKNKIIPTILSRCQIYDFNRITVPDITAHLSYVAQSEGITAETSALNVIATKSDGALRDALSIFDQIAASTRGNITYEATIANLNVLDTAVYTRLLDILLSGNVTAAWMLFKDVRDRGFDSHFFINGLADYLRNLMAARDASTRVLLNVGDKEWEELASAAKKCKPEFLYQAMVLCNDADLNYRNASNKQFLVEVLLAKLCQPLSPSPDNSGSGEGHLKPIPRSGAAPQPQAVSASSTLMSTPKPPATAQPTTTQIPRPTMQSSPTRQRRATVSASSIPRVSLNGGAIGEEKKETSTETIHAQRNRAFTGTALEKAWNDFRLAHPRDHLLNNTMRVCRPVMTENNRFIVVVESEAQEQSIASFATELMQYLRDTLENDHITYSVEINHGESSPRTWTEREVFANMVENNPMLQEFIKEFRLTLS